MIRTRPGGRPRRTAPLPASAICAGVPENAKRSSVSSEMSAAAPSPSPAATRAASAARSSGSNATVGSSAATTSRYIATRRRAMSRARAPSWSTTVTAPATTPTSRRPEPLARQPHHGRVRAAAELQLVRVLGRERRQPRRPGADEQRHPLALRRRTRGPRRARAGTPRPSKPERSPASRRDTISHASAIVVTGPALLDAEPVEPRAGRQAEERAAARGEVERGGLAGELDRVHVYGFRHEGPTRTRSVAPAISSSAGSAGWYQRSLNVGDDVEAAVLGDPRERRVLARRACPSAGRARARASRRSRQLGRRQPPAPDPLDRA